MNKERASKALADHGLSYGVTKSGRLVVCSGGELYTITHDDEREFYRSVSVLKAERDKSLRA